MKLFMVRHGAAVVNSARRYLGWDDVPLTVAGRRQAGALSRRLAAEPLVAVYSSDLLRARQTAEAIAAPHGLVVQAVSGLRELNFGDWSDLTYAEIAARDPQALQGWLADPEHRAPPGGETLAELRRRVEKALHGIALPAVAVAHGGTWRAVLGIWLSAAFWDIPQPPACLNMVQGPFGAETRPQVMLVGDTGHLGRRK